MNTQLSLLPTDPLASWSGIQSRYRAYCRAHGSTSAEEQIERDRQRWPCGVMTGFIAWIGERWRAWEGETGRRPPHGLEDHRDFDAWLERWRG